MKTLLTPPFIYFFSRLNNLCPLHAEYRSSFLLVFWFFCSCQKTLCIQNWTQSSSWSLTIPTKQDRYLLWLTSNTCLFWTSHSIDSYSDCNLFYQHDAALLASSQFTSFFYMWVWCLFCNVVLHIHLYWISSYWFQTTSPIRQNNFVFCSCPPKC